MNIHVRLGATKDGVIRAVDMFTLSNSGAYGEHGPTTVGLSGHKSIPLYTHNMKAFRFSWEVVYTNTMSAGAYRGYGATQGMFAMESAVNELAHRLDMDPGELRARNIVRQGEVMPGVLWRAGGQLHAGWMPCPGAGDDWLEGKISGENAAERTCPRCGHGAGDAGLRYFGGRYGFG